MLIYQDKEYNSKFPETYNWNKIDSIKLCKLALNYKGWIQHDLKNIDRNLVPGLRKALNIIAERAEI